MTVGGTYADGTAINPSLTASIYRMPDGYLSVRGLILGTRRFLGVRVSFDPARVTQTGAYSVDAAPGGAVKLYYLHPAPGEPDTDVVPPRLIIHTEVRVGTVILETLPTADRPRIVGSFQGVQLAEMGVPILQLDRGTFGGHVP